MTNEDVIRMAREAGIGVKKDLEDWHVPVWHLGIDYLARFAALVAAAERESCAKLCDDKAKETFSGQCQVWGDYFARAIRARGNT